MIEKENSGRKQSLIFAHIAWIVWMFVALSLYVMQFV